MNHSEKTEIDEEEKKKKSMIINYTPRNYSSSLRSSLLLARLAAIPSPPQILI